MINGEQSYILWSEKVGNLEIIFSESIVLFFFSRLSDKCEKDNAGNENQEHT